MPDRLSFRATVVLVGLAFGLAVAAQALLSGGSSAAAPAAKRSTAGLTAEAPAAPAPELKLVAAGAVPALRDPRVPRARRTHTREPEEVTPEPLVTPAPVVTATPTPPAPTPVPRAVQPAPRSTPKPTPAPTSSPPSGEFDTTGDE